MRCLRGGETGVAGGGDIMRRCPICANKAEYWNDYIDHTFLEEETRCLICGYYEYNGFGSYQCSIFGKQWEWSYRDDSKLKRQYYREIEIEEIYARCLRWLGLLPVVAYAETARKEAQP
jgi:hypothetical protein